MLNVDTMFYCLLTHLRTWNGFRLQWCFWRASRACSRQLMTSFMCHERNSKSPFINSKNRPLKSRCHFSTSLSLNFCFSIWQPCLEHLSLLACHDRPDLWNRTRSLLQYQKRKLKKNFRYFLILFWVKFTLFRVLDCYIKNISHLK